MQKSLRNDEPMLKCLERGIINRMDFDKIKRELKELEEMAQKTGSELPEENKKIFAKNMFRQSCGANQHDKEFVDFMWDRAKDKVLELIL